MSKERPASRCGGQSLTDSHQPQPFPEPGFTYQGMRVPSTLAGPVVHAQVAAGHPAGYVLPYGKRTLPPGPGFPG